MRVSKFSILVQRMPSGSFRGIVFDPLKEPIRVFSGPLRKTVREQCISLRDQLKSNATIGNDSKLAGV